MSKEIKGVIINTASLGGLQGGRAGLSYTASKFAVVGMTKNIAFMYSDTGIRCNAICPGAVMTNIGLGSNAPSPRGTQKMQVGMPLCTSFADPYQLANVALFLASENSSFINGAAITADGGWSAYEYFLQYLINTEAPFRTEPLSLMREKKLFLPFDSTEETSGILGELQHHAGLTGSNRSGIAFEIKEIFCVRIGLQLFEDSDMFINERTFLF